MKKTKRFRNLSEIKRRSPIYDGAKRIVIITEGTKTEYSYFMLLRQELNIPKMWLQIASSNGSSPKNVFEAARKLIQEANENEIEAIYCVFDSDRHSTFTEAINSINRLSKRSQRRCKMVVPIPSIPCFEYWFLLHVNFSTKNYNDAVSPCEALIEDLRTFKHFKHYEKSNFKTIFHNIEKVREKAISNSKKVLSNAVSVGEHRYQENPSTRVHFVVERLQELSELLSKNTV